MWLVSAAGFDTQLRELTFGRQAPIFIGSDKRIDTSRHEPDPSLLTWMRALKVCMPDMVVVWQ